MVEPPGQFLKFSGNVREVVDRVADQCAFLARCACGIGYRVVPEVREACAQTRIQCVVITTRRLCFRVHRLAFGRVVDDERELIERTSELV